jgi:hypothetical protein
VNVHPVEVEGNEDLLKTVVSGDFVYGAGVPDERMVERLGGLLRRDPKMPVKLALREVERDLDVARGTYRYKPMPGREDNDIHIYGLEFVEDTGAGGGSGDFGQFLKWVRHPRPTARTVGGVPGRSPAP